jgi:rod shape-determining protein MreD
MRWVRFAVLVSLLTVLQASLVDIFAVANIKPDLLLISLVFFAINCNVSEAIIISFTLGFAADIIGPAMGPQIISFGLFGTLLAKLSRLIAIRKMPYQSVAILITGFLVGVLAHFFTFLKAQPTVPNTYTVLLATSFYSALVGPFLFLPLGWWMRVKIHRISRY